MEKKIDRENFEKKIIKKRKTKPCGETL